MLPGSVAKRSDWGAVLCLALVALLPPPHGAATTPAGADCNCPQRFSVGPGAPKGDCSCSFCPYDPKTSYSPHPGYSLVALDARLDTHAVAHGKVMALVSFVLLPLAVAMRHRDTHPRATLCAHGAVLVCLLYAAVCARRVDAERPAPACCAPNVSTIWWDRRGGAHTSPAPWPFRTGTASLHARVGWLVLLLLLAYVLHELLIGLAKVHACCSGAHAQLPARARAVFETRVAPVLRWLLLLLLLPCCCAMGLALLLGITDVDLPSRESAAHCVSGGAFVLLGVQMLLSGSLALNRGVQHKLEHRAFVVFGAMYWNAEVVGNGTSVYHPHALTGMSFALWGLAGLCMEQGFPRPAARGLATCCALLWHSTMMLMHHQTTPMGILIHRAHAVALFCVAVARAHNALEASGISLIAAGWTLVAGQKGMTFLAIGLHTMPPIYVLQSLVVAAVHVILCLFFFNLGGFDGAGILAAAAPLLRRCSCKLRPPGSRVPEDMPGRGRVSHEDGDEEAGCGEGCGPEGVLEAAGRHAADTHARHVAMAMACRSADKDGAGDEELRGLLPPS